MTNIWQRWITHRNIHIYISVSHWDVHTLLSYVEAYKWQLCLYLYSVSCLLMKYSSFVVDFTAEILCSVDSIIYKNVMKHISIPGYARRHCYIALCIERFYFKIVWDLICRCYMHFYILIETIFHVYSFRGKYPIFATLASYQMINHSQCFLHGYMLVLAFPF